MQNGFALRGRPRWGLLRNDKLSPGQEVEGNHGEGTGSRHRLLGEDGVERCNLQKSNVFEQEGVKHKMRAHTDLPGNQVELGPMSQAARVKGPRSAPSGLGPASSGLCFLFPALPISVDFRNYSLDHREQFFKVVAHGVV